MEFSLNSTSINKWTGSQIIFGLFEGDFDSQLSNLQSINKNVLLERLADQDFKAKEGEITNFSFLEECIDKIIFIGLGSSNDLTLDSIRQAIARGARTCIGSTGALGVYVPLLDVDENLAFRAICESIRLSLFKDLRFRSSPDPFKIPSQIEILGFPESTQVDIKKVNPICAGVELARELVGAPPNSLTPNELANTAIQIAEEFDLQFKILNREECKSLGMGSFLAVAQGSDLEPKFIHLTYKPTKSVKKRLAIVGKGLTFDSGGYNLKVGNSQIEMMKYDMGGSAAVLGAARSIGEIRPANTEIHFIVASCENMVNGSAVHPGDIVTASNGKTIEINNTDAEGRLTLADALIYACKLEPDAIVDLATLTGACVIALGDEIAGLWTENDQLASELESASREEGEGIWRMPLPKSYKEGLKSMFADIKNTGPRAGGSITAALFLKEFVQPQIPWAHIDIAGTCWTDKDRGINPAGATGFGVRTLTRWACK